MKNIETNLIFSSKLEHRQKIFNRNNWPSVKGTFELDIFYFIYA